MRRPKVAGRWLAHTPVGRFSPVVAARALTLALLGVVWCAGLPNDADAQSLGRLFSSVEQRLELDEIRDEYEYGKPVRPPSRPTNGHSEGGEKGPTVPQVTVNGVVLRSSGVNASWVNGTGILAGEATAEGIQVVTRPGDQGGEVRLVLPSGADTAPIKPGQKIDVINGRVVDTYTLPKASGAKAPLFGANAPGATTGGMVSGSGALPSSDPPPAQPRSPPKP